MTYEQDIERLREHYEAEKSWTISHAKALVFGLLFSSPFCAILAYCYWWVR